MPGRFIAVASLCGLFTFPALVLAGPAEEAGRALYQTNCMNCHGQNLQGGNAKSMVDGVWEYGGSRAQLAASIKNGIVDVGMPAYGATMNDPQIDSIVSFVREQENRSGVERPKFPEELKTQDYTLDVDLFAQGLKTPWSIAFIDKATAIVTEKDGRVRMMNKGVLAGQPVRDTPKVLSFGQGGLMDVAIDPDYATTGWVYLAYTHGLEGGQRRAMTRVVRGKIHDDAWIEEQVVWEAKAEHYSGAGVHFGCRIVFDDKGHLYFGVGERGAKEQAQELARPNGKIHRINRDGSIPADNPFVNEPNAYKSIFTFGNRNPQGLAVQPATGLVYETEHGPRGGDELNLIKPGVNYGWPVITYGINYNGQPISDISEKEGMEQPLKYWTPSIAACGLDVVTGDLFPKWKGHLLAGGLALQELHVVKVDREKVLSDEIILKGAGRVRDVVCGPDGAIYVVLNSPDIIVRLRPRS